MDGMVRVACPEGCDYFILGEVHEAVPLLWEHLVIGHNRPSVSSDHVYQAMSCVIPVRAGHVCQE